MSAARPCSRAAANASPMLSVIAETLDDLGEVLVAAAAQTQERVALAPRRIPEQPGDRVRGLERGDDPLQSRELAECLQRLAVGDRLVASPPRVAKLGMLRADAGIVESGGDRVRLEDLSLTVREHRGERAVE